MGILARFDFPLRDAFCVFQRTPILPGKKPALRDDLAGLIRPPTDERRYRASHRQLGHNGSAKAKVRIAAQNGGRRFSTMWTACTLVRLVAKGIKIRDRLLGDGEEARLGKTVVLRLQTFLSRGEEVFLYPEPKVRIDLKGRPCIPGLRKGIIGMRVGGVRTITISPHLVFGAEGALGIPPNAVLRCEVELLEVWELRARKPEDFPPAKRIFVFHPGEAARNLPRWQFGMDEEGRCGVLLSIPIPELSWRHVRTTQIQWQMDRDVASALIEETMALPTLFPGECLPHADLWSDHAEPKNGITRDRKTDTLCLTLSVSERGQWLSYYAIRENSPALQSSELLQVIHSKLEPQLGVDADETRTGDASG